MFSEKANGFYLNRAKKVQKLIGERILKDFIPLEAHCWPCKEPVQFADRMDGEYCPISEGEQWGSGHDRAWFRLNGVLPEHWEGEQLIAWLDINTEGLLFDPNGTVIQGIKGLRY